VLQLIENITYVFCN